MDGLVCSEECTSAGCWSTGNRQCLECKHFTFNQTCIKSCKSEPNIYQLNSNTCASCHPECKNSCNGPNADNCMECLNDQDGNICVAKCPLNKYSNNGKCVPCHPVCVGCNGPQNTLGEDGCISCDNAIIGGDANVEKCLMKNESCPGKCYIIYIN